MKTTKNINELTPIETALQQQFKPDANSVRAAFQIVENNRAEFSINAMKFGFCALAAKAIIGYGKFGDWLKAALSENGNERIMAYSTACDYIGYAKVFIRKLENPEKIAGSLADGVREFCGRFEISEIEDFKIEEVLQNSKKTIILLEKTVGKMTRKQMQQLFREGAEQAYTDEQQRKTALTKRELKSLANGESENGQTNFFDALFTETRATIETSRSDARFVEMSAEQLINYGNYLIAQGKDIVDIGNKKKD